MITASLTYSGTTISHTLMEMPITMDYGDNYERQQALDGSSYVDYSFTKRKWTLNFGFLSNTERAALRTMIYNAHFTNRSWITFTLTNTEGGTTTTLETATVFVEMKDWKLASKCLRADNVKLTLTEV